jgi:hypothetical protein
VSIAGPLKSSVQTSDQPGAEALQPKRQTAAESRISVFVFIADDRFEYVVAFSVFVGFIRLVRPLPPLQGDFPEGSAFSVRAG